eukprot:CAMPEP_0115508060 /NCGR_PEP_ID=MMETSP0271-20121206/72092_1 /TAXON_ID=71861 /ORGANISM="Scrippsiella trochoidea, Strain CCMP3099" /LENGTH=96 /DNA_ID=CAMNT_0002937761 /DNA_START=17 /DNA_END=304 /DNA_ORIENTATION=+
MRMPSNHCCAFLVRLPAFVLAGALPPPPPAEAPAAAAGNFAARAEGGEARAEHHATCAASSPHIAPRGRRGRPDSVGGCSGGRRAAGRAAGWLVED